MAGLTLNLKRATKKINSTSVTANNEKTVTGVVLKAGTDILDPVFIIKNPYTVIPNTINYLQCVDFNRYYWIRTIVQSSGGTGGSAAFIELHCHVDVLGSWKTLIGNTPCFVKYCSDKTWSKNSVPVVDLTQDDERLSSDRPLTSTTTTLLNDTVASWFTGNPVYQPFAITLGQLGPGITSSKIYVLKRDDFSKFFKALWETSAFESQVSDSDSFYKWMAEKLGGVLLDPASFIQDIRQLPFYCDGTTGDPLYSADGLVKVAVGKMKEIKDGATTIWGRDYKGHNNFTLEAYAVELDIPGLGKPDADFDVAFLRRKKYMQVIMTTPFGDLNLSTDNFVEKNNNENKVKLWVKFIAERTTGDIGIQVFDQTTGELLGKVSGNLSLNQTHMIQPGGYAQNAVAGQLKNANSILNSVGGIATIAGGAIGMAAGGPAGAAIGAAIGSAVSAGSHLIGGLTTNVTNAVETATSNGGSIIGNSNSWMDMYLQTGTNNSSYSPPLVTDFTKLFRVICTVFIPKVCISKAEYQNYAKYFGYPCNKMVDKFSDIKVDNVYIQASNFNINLSTATTHDEVMLPEEANEINAFLNTGIYWETSQIRKEADQDDQPPEVNPSK